jgi:hypothetical protein
MIAVQRVKQDKPVRQHIQQVQGTRSTGSPSLRPYGRTAPIRPPSSKPEGRALVFGAGIIVF